MDPAGKTYGIGCKYIRKIHVLESGMLGYVHCQGEWASILFATIKRFSHLQVDVQFKPAIGNTYIFEIGCYDVESGINLTLCRIFFNAAWYAENGLVVNEWMQEINQCINEDLDKLMNGVGCNNPEIIETMELLKEAVGMCVH